MIQLETILSKGRRPFMNGAISEIAFTAAVKAAQEERGSRGP